MYSLDLSTAGKSASSNAIAWMEQNKPPFAAAAAAAGAAELTMAEASNHILFFGVPSLPSGSADIFVIHYSYYQPDAQPFTLTNGASTNFPTSSGAAVGVPLASNGAGNQVVFIPDDFSNTFLITHWTSPSTAGSTNDAPAGIMSYINTTQTLPAPESKDVQANYVSSDTSLVQMTSSGDIYYLEGAYGDGYAAKSDASWKKLAYTVNGVSAASQNGGGGGSGNNSSSSSTNTGSGTATRSGSTTASGTGTGTGASSSQTGTGTSGAIHRFDALGGKQRDVGMIGVAVACIGIALFAF